MEAVSTNPGEKFLLKFRLCLSKIKKINQIYVFFKKKESCSKLFYDQPDCDFDNPAKKFTFSIQKFWCSEKVGVFFRGKMLDTQKTDRWAGTFVHYG